MRLVVCEFWTSAFLFFLLCLSILPSFLPSLPYSLLCSLYPRSIWYMIVMVLAEEHEACSSSWTHIAYTIVTFCVDHHVSINSLLVTRQQPHTLGNGKTVPPARVYMTVYVCIYRPPPLSDPSILEAWVASF